GIYGEGEVVAVIDTGLDDESCYFRDPVMGKVPRQNLATSNDVYPDHRKVVQYITWGDQRDKWGGSAGDGGHGTHVCGSIAGSIYDDWEFKGCDRDETQTCWGSCLTDQMCAAHRYVGAKLGTCQSAINDQIYHW
ncbi:unnamed protein product, partial [Chrysoparadoxa australica]